MKKVKPAKLNKGDLIGIISPASTPDDLTRIDKGVQYLEKLGYRTEVAPNVGKVRGYLAGHDDQRLYDLHYMFRKKDVKAIFCVRGGYGSPRLLDKIDFKLIAKNPKIFVGYSDITVLHLALLKKTGLITFAGPMVATDFGKDEVSTYTEEHFWKTITTSKKIGNIVPPGEDKLFSLNKGKAKGELTGGNLALMMSLAGTPLFPELKGKILMIEDIGEQPYRVDRLVNQLKLMGAFKQLKGIILGAFTDCLEPDFTKRTLTLNEVIEDYFEKLSIPVIYNFPHGHINDLVTVPFGIDVSINASKHTVEFTENAVS
jgi:muramoyltetrapeptide carboxypeptidase